MKCLNLINLFLLFSAVIYPQYYDKDFSVSVNGVYTTSASVYLTPFSSDPFLRNNAFPLEDIFNPAIEFRYKVSEALMLGFGTEYMKSLKAGPNLTVFGGNSTINIVVDDGFILIPLEFTLFYILPFSTEDFKFAMGGGVGYYLGEHVRQFGQVKVSNVERKTAYGIHVLISGDYMITDFLSARGEMKFRDPQFTVTSKYNKREVEHNGVLITLPQQSFDSKINVDGVTFILGIAFHF